jgi:hypothetical protein
MSFNDTDTSTNAAADTPALTEARARVNTLIENIRATKGEEAADKELKFRMWIRNKAVSVGAGWKGFLSGYGFSEYGEWTPTAKGPAFPGKAGSFKEGGKRNNRKSRKNRKTRKNRKNRKSRRNN